MLCSIPIALKSQNVCRSCRTGKQRCDKSLPSCSRCTSKLLHCDYNWYNAGPRPSPSPSTVTMFVVHQSCCLDLSTYGACELIHAVSSGDKASQLARLVCQMLNDAQLTTLDIENDYLATIHSWLPIFDKDNFRSRLDSRLQSNDAESATLMSALLLVTRRPCADSRHSMSNLMYQTIKHAFMLRASEVATLELLQAGILITYYACGHGLPRDAHMVLANCVAMARLMGIDFEDFHNLSGTDSQFSASRWAIVLLDRTVALSSIHNLVPLTLPLSPGSDVKSITSMLDPQGPYQSFDITSRVALLIGAALSYANDPRPIRLTVSAYGEIYDRLENLVRELVCTSKTGQDTYTYCESTALAVITLLSLQAVNPNKGDVELVSKEGMLLQSTLRMVRDQFRATTVMMPEEKIEGMPVVALCALSRAAIIVVRLCGSELPNEELEELRLNLKRFGTRWTIGRVYLQHIDEDHFGMEA